MVETASVQLTHRGRLSGGGLKPPKGALVKSHGAERLGNPVPRVQAGMDKGDEQK